MKSKLIGTGAAIAIGFGVLPTQAQQAANVQARTTPSGIAVTWRLAQPTKEVGFLDPDIIRNRWTVTTPGLMLADGVIRSKRPFKTFEVLITPDAAEVDRVYMGLVRAGAGYVLYGPGLALKDMDAALTLRPAPGQTALPATRAISGYAYLGPKAAVRHKKGGSVVAGANVPASLLQLIANGFLAAQTFYGARLGRTLPYEPVLIVTVDSPGPTMFRSDVTDTGVIAARFFGTSWDAPTDDVIGQLSTLAWHETSHLWNGHGVVLKDGRNAPWLHEGAAEYGALVAASTAGVIDQDREKSSLAQRLNGCRSALGRRDYDSRILRSGAAVYDCGVVIQWLADLETRRASGGRRDIFDLWKTMLDAGRAGNGYGVADFRALLIRDSGVATLLDDPGADRWSRIEARLKGLGVVLTNQPSRADYRRAALFHLNTQNCTGVSGFYNLTAGIKLDTGDRCGVLSGDPVLASVEGHDPVTDAAAMFVAVQARCAQSLPVRYHFRDGRAVEAKCAAPIDPPEAWTIATAPRLLTRSN